MIEEKLKPITPLITEWDFLNPNRPTLTMCACGGQPQCYHDEDTGFGVECYECSRYVSGHTATIDAIGAWNELMAKIVKDRDNG